jgi:hypothetical protein
MSWMPSADPVLGDKRSCDALELVVVPRVRDLVNGFAVRRAMPNEKRQLVDPFIFFDQMGSVQFLAGQGMDVRPHTHPSDLPPSHISSTVVLCIATARGIRWRLHPVR